MMNNNNASTTTNGDRRAKRPSNRPAMQIYRPPGLRNGEDATNTKPIPTAGAKQLKKDIIKRTSEENNNESGKCALTNALNGCNTRKKSTDESDGSLPRADSALSNDSTTSSQGSLKSQNSHRRQNQPLLGDTNSMFLSANKQNLKRSTNRVSPAVSPKATQQNAGSSAGGGGGFNMRTGSDQPQQQRGSRKDGTPYSRNNSSVNREKDAKRKALTPKQIEELAGGLRKLDLAKENSLIEQFITNDFDGEECGAAVGQMLVQFSIEENRQAGKAVARIAAQLLDSGAAQSFHQGTITALVHYFDCRDRLRIDHFRVWIAFLNFVSDLYSNVGYIYEGELVNLVFRIFDYLLKAPVLETLKIEELESLIGCLLSGGYDLERQCPEQLAVLKDRIRDAFVEVQEPWARKMILLLMELGASGWKLPAEANEYYFQQTSS